jgi:hypothetical protein
VTGLGPEDRMGVADRSIRSGHSRGAALGFSAWPRLSTNVVLSGREA